MGLYNYNSGVLTPIAGRGKAEYGASTVRTGFITVEGDGSSSFITVNVTFDTPMPDANYIVDINPYTASWERTQWRTLNQTANGFRFDATRVDGAAMLTAKYYYTAYKLYTDNEYNNILAATPSNASASNKFLTQNFYKTCNIISETNGNATVSRLGDEFLLVNISKTPLVPMGGTETIMGNVGTTLGLTSTDVSPILIGSASEVWTKVYAKVANGNLVLINRDSSNIPNAWYKGSCLLHINS